MNKMKRYESYKDSDIKWLGRIPENWEISRLKNLGSAIIGLTYSPDDIVEKNKGILVLRSSNIQNDLPDFSNTVYVDKKPKKSLITKSGDILICSRNGSRALIGKNIRIDNNTSGYTFGAFMTIYRSNYSRYLSYFFKSQLFDYQSGAFMTSTINQLTISTLNQLTTLFPPLPEQTAIAVYLDSKTDSLDKKVNLLKKKIGYYQELRKSIIKETVTKGLDKNVKMKEGRIDLGDFHWVRPIPEHWSIHRVDWITFIIRGNTGFGKDELLDNGEYVALQYGKTYQVDEVNSSFQYFVNSEFYKQTQIVNQGDTILISTSETIEDLGHSCFYNRYDLGLIGGEQILLKPNRKLIIGKYLYYCSKEFGTELRKSATGLKVFRFNTNNLKQIFIALPPLEEQIQIADYLTATTTKIDQIIQNIQTQITTLKELRKTLINDVVTGKIKVIND